MMNQFMKNLLKLSYENYLKTGDTTYRYQPKNGDEIFYYTEAAKYLDSEGLIEAISDNILSDVSNPFQSAIVFNLTELGVQKASEN